MKLMIVALLAQVGASVSERPSLPSPQDTVVVVGRRLATGKEALARCIARKCPPKEEIRLSMNYAQDQFIAGKYQGASATLSRARDRNIRFAQTYPEEVSGLLQFKGDIAALLGYYDAARTGSIAALDALKKGDSAQERIAMQRLIVGDGFIREGRIRAGSDVYDAVAKQAERAGWPALRGLAMLRAAGLYGHMAAVDAKFAQTARRRFAALRDTRDPTMAPFRSAVGIMEARIAFQRGDESAIERLIAGIQPVDKPVLVVAGVVDPQLPGCTPSGMPSSDMGGVNVREGEFLDLRFLIRPDGRVADVEELARGRGAVGVWPSRVRDALGSRRYLPLRVQPGSPGLVRSERFTVVREMQKVTGSSLMSPCGPPRIEVVDLTAGEAIRQAASLSGD